MEELKKIDYSKLNEITVKSQQELDEIPLSFEGKVYVEFGTYYSRAIIKNKYYYSVVARGNSSVVARGNSSVVARGNSSVVARGNSSVVARENSSVVARENSSVVARGNSSVVAWENSSVEARGNSSVVARGNSSVVAWENSSVEAWGNSSVVAWGNTQVVDYLQGAKIKISGNSRIVYMPKGVIEFLDFYGIKHTKTKATLYKTVHKIDDQYASDYTTSFTYTIGQLLDIECNNDVKDNCSYGIHLSHLNWALDFGSNWKDLAILECSVKIEDIVLPKDSDGKVRTGKVNIVREVPLNECGLYGKILARRRGNG